MTGKKLIVVIGATGNQGGSVVNAFHGDPSWTIRAFTRNPSSAKATALAARGVEVVKADMDDPSSLPAAFKDANAIFVVSDFWGLYGSFAQQGVDTGGKPLNLFAGEHELQQLKAAIDAAAKVPTLERFILSTLSAATKWSKGKYTHVYHFDIKAQASAYVEEVQPELWKKTSLFQPGFFLSGYVYNPNLMPRKNADGVAQFFNTMKGDFKTPWLAPEEDSGAFVKALIVDEAPGKNLIAYREWATLQEMAQAFEKASGVKSEIVEVPVDAPNEHLPAELKIELDEGYLYWEEFGYEARDDPTVIHPKDLKNPPKLETMEQFYQKQDFSRIFSA
ncbi:hypothetical protein A0O28_0006280 [Trichoderma guizhouense]|uniref:NmrA-like domain-containing protein n=1 Tax=Trichoderma guizhouense TaxID=1491466 RepID=A0A1T3CHH0_9HYPO|nr:hypothetical protein A0O28_0006280 [Trichoderma guizhouense]